MRHLYTHDAGRPNIGVTESRSVKYIYQFENGETEVRTAELEPMDFDVSVPASVAWHIVQNRPDLRDAEDIGVYVNYRDNSLTAFLFSGGDE